MRCFVVSGPIICNCLPLDVHLTSEGPALLRTIYDVLYKSYVVQWFSSTVLALQSLGSGLDSHWGQGCIATLGKLLTPMCLCYQAA